MPAKKTLTAVGTIAVSARANLSIFTNEIANVNY